MYLYIGGHVILDKDKIIGIFDMESTSVSKYTRDFLKKAQKDLAVEEVSGDIPKSFILCKDKDKNHKLYISQLAASTLKKRNQSREWTR